MLLSLIVAASRNNVIGRGNNLPWHLPNDLKFFKNTTWGMPVAMGRKTFESISGEPLPGRQNIVITRSIDWQPDREGVWVVHSLPQAIEKAGETDSKELFIAGGGQIFEEAILVADRIYITRIHADIDGDAFFPAIDERIWKMVYHLDFETDDRHAYPYSFQTWERK